MKTSHDLFRTRDLGGNHADIAKAAILKSWIEHYNRDRPHSNLGPGVPDPPDILVTLREPKARHRLGEGVTVLSKAVPGGLHHEYSLAPSLV